jgi:ABC-type anion transport system duplicated permease subunit
MAGINDDAKKMLDEFLKTASPDEIKELYRLLDEREKRGGGGKVDVQNLAGTMSKQIQEQLGLASLNTKKMARNMVVQMARKYKPEITDRELAQIVNSMVPEKKSSAVKIPADILKTMVIQFVAYSSGDMSISEKRNMPQGWEKKYWDAFPEEVKNLIASYLKGNINKKDFWNRVRKAL